MNCDVTNSGGPAMRFTKTADTFPVFNNELKPINAAQTIPNFTYGQTECFSTTQNVLWGWKTDKSRYRDVENLPLFSGQRIKIPFNADVEVAGNRNGR